MIEIENRDDIAILYMEHGKANVLDLEFCSALATQIDDLASSARAIVLTSRGSIFSAGVDLLRIIDDGDDYIRRVYLLRSLPHSLHGGPPHLCLGCAEG